MVGVTTDSVHRFGGQPRYGDLLEEALMPIERLPSGTRGARMPPRPLMRILMPLMERIHRRSGDRFRGGHLLYLTTLGAKSGEQRTNPVARFDDGAGGWYIVVSYGGSARHPGWYHNMVAHPDQVYVEVAGVKRRVAVEQLEGAARDEAWKQVTAKAPSFLDYTAKTDRELPVLRLTPVTEGQA
jgi:deazaflavin-dependent oxidoreductase (nitroreductase family)